MQLNDSIVRGILLETLDGNGCNQRNNKEIESPSRRGLVLGRDFALFDWTGHFE